MGLCELCGKKESNYNTEIEGTMMSVCENCSKFGNVKGSSKVNIVIKEKNKFERKEPTYIFIKGFGASIKNTREKMNLNQEDFAKKLSIRVSLLHKIESEHMHPDIETAKKLERTLHIKLVEEISENEENSNKQKELSGPHFKSGPLTFGDMINIKRKK